MLLLKELRAAAVAEAKATGKARLLISIAVPTGAWAVGPGYDIAGLAPSLDWCGLMTYDFSGASIHCRSNHMEVVSILNHIDDVLPGCMLHT